MIIERGTAHPARRGTAADAGSLAFQESEQGAHHPDVATTLDRLAELYAAKGDQWRAEPLYLRALTIQERAGTFAPRRGRLAPHARGAVPGEG